MFTTAGLTIENLIIVVLTYLLILFVNRKTKSNAALLMIAILTFHHIVAYLYAFYLDRPQYEVDPIGFMRLARECTEFGYCGYLGMHLYANYLAKVLAIGGSVYFVFLLNILLFVISLYYFIQLAKFFGLDRNKKLYIFFYGMWPSVIYFTTLNYREPFELYLLIVAVYFGVTGSKTDSLFRMLTSMVLLLLMGLFHIKGLIFLSPILFLILVSYHCSLSPVSIIKKITLLVFMSSVAYYAQDMYVPNLKFAANNTPVEVVDKKKSVKPVNAKKIEVTTKTDKMSERRITRINVSSFPKEVGIVDQFINKVIAYRYHIVRDRVPRTAFISNISDENIFIFVTTYFLVYLEYLFAPFIFQVSTFHGVIAYAESVLRVIFFASALVLLKRKPHLSILFIIYLAITAMWAIGVASYGAAIRHHIQTNWILVLLGIPVISEYIRKRITQKNRKLDYGS